MKKKVLLSMMLLSAVTAGSVPVTSHAASVKVVQIQGGEECRIPNESAEEYIRQLLNQWCIPIDINDNNCSEAVPPVQETPGPEIPGTGMPDVDVPDSEIPGTGAGTPSVPEAGGSDAGSTAPGTSAPGTSTPGTSAPEEPETPAPGVQEPEEDKSEAEALSYAEQVAKLVNAERAKAGVPQVEVQTDLTAAANVRAKEIRQKFSHTRPDGSSFSSVLKEQGISYRGSGENIAYGQKTPEKVMEAWMNSDGHRANILNENFKNIGVGYYQDEKGVNYWVQLFTY